MQEFAVSSKVKAVIFPVYKELSARDVLQRRITVTDDDVRDLQFFYISDS